MLAVRIDSNLRHCIRICEICSKCDIFNLSCVWFCACFCLCLKRFRRLLIFHVHSPLIRHENSFCWPLFFFFFAVSFPGQENINTTQLHVNPLQARSTRAININRRGKTRCRNLQYGPRKRG